MPIIIVIKIEKFKIKFIPLRNFLFKFKMILKLLLLIICIIQPSLILPEIIMEIPLSKASKNNGYNNNIIIVLKINKLIKI